MNSDGQQLSANISKTNNHLSYQSQATKHNKTTKEQVVIQKKSECDSTKSEGK
jgi:hypothetical protein